MTEKQILDPVFPTCPIRNVLSRICEKWTILIMLELGDNPDGLRHRELAKAIPDVSTRVLTASLRRLEADGLISRHIFPEVPPRVEYSLTERGKTLMPLIDSLVQWGAENLSSILKDRKKFLKTKQEKY